MWHRVKASDPLAREIRDRHYSTKNPGGRTVGPPGRRLVLISDDEHAMWITHYPDPRLVLDRIDALRCTLFRREGRRRERASVLIDAAMRLSEEVYGAAPAGWVTYVEPSKVRSQDPGYCFKMAGFELDTAFASKRLIRLRRGPLTRNDLVLMHEVVPLPSEPTDPFTLPLFAPLPVCVGGAHDAVHHHADERDGERDEPERHHESENDAGDVENQVQPIKQRRH